VKRLLLAALFFFPVATSAVMDMAPVLAAVQSGNSDAPPEEETADHEVLLANTLVVANLVVEAPVLSYRLSIPEPDLTVPPPPPDGLLS